MAVGMMVASSVSDYCDTSPTWTSGSLNDYGRSQRTGGSCEKNPRANVHVGPLLHLRSVRRDTLCWFGAKGGPYCHLTDAVVIRRAA